MSELRVMMDVRLDDDDDDDNTDDDDDLTHDNGWMDRKQCILCPM